MSRTFSRNTLTVWASVSWQRHIHVSIVPFIQIQITCYKLQVLLHCYWFSQIPGLAYIHSLANRNMVSRQLKRYRSNQQIEAFDCFGKFDTTIGDFVDDCISLGLKFSFENNIVFDDTSALLLGWERLFLYQYSLPFHAHYSVFILVANIHISNNIKIINSIFIWQKRTKKLQIHQKVK